MSDVEILGVEPDDDDPYRFVWAMDPRTRETRGPCSSLMAPTLAD
jgi:hypothetical protein